MKLIQSTIQKTFIVEHKGKCYSVDFLDSDGHILGLLNRYTWEVRDEEFEELNIYEFSTDTQKEKEVVKKNRKLADKLIEFCIKHFDDFKAEL